MTTPAGHDDELTSSAPGRVSRSVERASIAVFAVFFLNGFNFATWAARLPAIRDGLDFSPAQMGLLLLVGSVGSLVALPLSGMVVERLHNLKPGTCYPATLVTTADHDDRVVPSHSFKFVAALQQAQGCDRPALIRVEVDGSHGYRPTDRLIAERADQWSFAAAHLKLEPS